MKNIFLLILFLSIFSCKQKDNNEISIIGVEIYNGTKPYAFFYNVDFENNKIIRYTINIEFSQFIPSKSDLDKSQQLNKRRYKQDSLTGEISLQIVPKNVRSTSVLIISEIQKNEILKIISNFNKNDLSNKYYLIGENIVNPFISKYHLIYKNGDIIDVEREFNLSDNHFELNEKLQSLFIKDNT